MKRYAALLLPLFTLVVMFCTSCAERHFISDAAFRAQMEEDLRQKMATYPDGQLFDILQSPELSVAEREALQFLYAYMPLSDLADYSGDYHLMNVRASLQARREMAWGEQVPELLFRHFVLPVRTNREALDSSRVVFYEELKPRVAHLSMPEAILEVNHWCHEKATYTPSDSRTSSPLATVRTAYGRCGEESVLLVAALRSIGIPARQVYTPRWAHTDDNHAWVEAWAGDGWHFLGACEPEPVLDLGWFNAPAARGMLMHSKVFGRYNGPEEVMKVASTYTEINVTDHYAPTAAITVEVTDGEGAPVADAQVEFKLYNYAEFYSVATKRSDAQGRCSLTAGKGDMVVWASKEGKYGYAKVSFGKEETVRVALTHLPCDAVSEEWDLLPPPEGVTLPEVTDAQRSENNRRMAQEDSIRLAYTQTFCHADAARTLAREEGLDEALTIRMLVGARGNHATLRTFLCEQPTPEGKATALDMLSRLSAKDLRDVPIEVLRDHLQSTSCCSQEGKEEGKSDRETFLQYVRNPRVIDEPLSPCKSFFKQAFSAEEAEAYRANPMLWVKRVTEEIRIVPDCNTGSSPITPEGVWRAKAADAHSRDIYFVAVARSLGIPARIDEVTGKVQLITSEQGMLDIRFGESEPQKAPSGTLVLDYKPTKVNSNPKYYNHFTLSRITDEATLQLLNYDEGDIDMGGGATWQNTFRQGASLDEGSYLMVTGTRLASGGVLAHMQQISVREGQRTNETLLMRQSSDQVQVIGNFNSESLFTRWDGNQTGNKQSLLQACGRGYFVVGVIGVGQEPTNHALRDIAALRQQLEEWGRTLVLLFPNEEAARRYKASDFPGLPSSVVYGIDTDGIAQQMIGGMKLNAAAGLPIFLIADTFNRVVFVSQGYTIGLGEQLMKTVNGL